MGGSAHKVHYHVFFGGQVTYSRVRRKEPTQVIDDSKEPTWVIDDSKEPTQVVGDSKESTQVIDDSKEPTRRNQLRSWMPEETNLS